MRGELPLSLAYFSNNKILLFLLEPSFFVTWEKAVYGTILPDNSGLPIRIFLGIYVAI